MSTEGRSRWIRMHDVGDAIIRTAERHTSPLGSVWFAAVWPRLDLGESGFRHGYEGAGAHKPTLDLTLSLLRRACFIFEEIDIGKWPLGFAREGGHCHRRKVSSKSSWEGSTRRSRFALSTGVGYGTVQFLVRKGAKVREIYYFQNYIANLTVYLICITS